MSVVRPEFLKVLSVDAERVGPVAACVLALVRYTTAREDPLNDRLLIDGHVWWRASYDEIGIALGGMGRYAVRRIIAPLVDAGELASLIPGIAEGDQTRAYRVASDQPMCDNATPLTGQCADSQGGVADSQQGVADSQQGGCESARSIPYREVREREGEKGGALAPPPPAIFRPDEDRGPFGPRCPDHADDPDPPRCPGCRDARLAAEALREAQTARVDAERAAILTEIAACEECGPHGITEPDDDEPSSRCTRHRQLTDARPRNGVGT